MQVWMEEKGGVSKNFVFIKLYVIDGYGNLIMEREILDVSKDKFKWKLIVF